MKRFRKRRFNSSFIIVNNKKFSIIREGILNYVNMLLYLNYVPPKCICWSPTTQYWENNFVRDRAFKEVINQNEVSRVNLNSICPISLQEERSRLHGETLVVRVHRGWLFKDSVRRWLSVSLGDRPQRKPTMLAYWSWTFIPQR